MKTPKGGSRRGRGPRRAESHSCQTSKHLTPSLSPERRGRNEGRLRLFQALAGQVEEVENFAAEAEKISAVALARTFQADGDGAFNAAGRRAHDDDAVAHVDGFVDVMGHQQY